MASYEDSLAHWAELSGPRRRSGHEPQDRKRSQVGGEGGPAPKKPVRPLVLDRTGNRAGFPTWGTGLYFSQAGCYAMTASWAGGQWRLLFAVGR